MSSGPLKILFVLLHPGYVRNYESTIRLLLERGHRIHLAFSQPAKQATDQLAERLDAEYERLTFGRAPKREGGGWRKVAWTTRSLMDFARYLHPRYAGAPLLRERVADKIQRKSPELGILGSFAVGFVRVFGRMRSARLSAFWIGFLRYVEEAIPPSRAIEEFTLSQEPDLMLVTPIVNIGSNEVEYVKSARRLGIPCGLCVASWDNLSNKGLIRIEPDRLFVWNATQLREAVEMHGIAARKVVMTGAQRFDEWFEMKVRRTREEFSIAAGLNAAQPFLLYLCSSPFIAPDETGFVERWIRAIRAAKDLARYGVLIRPHPQNVAQWQDVDFSHLDNVSIWPRAGAQPIDAISKNDFYESTYFSAAVAGVNTSALIEAAIVGKSVFTVLDPEFQGTQRGTLHFHYLLHENGGFLHVASDMDAHIAQLSKALANMETHAQQTKRFIGSFIRPFGTDVPGTPVLGDAVEKLGALKPVPPRRSLVAIAVAIPLRVVVMSARAGRAAKRALRAAARRARPFVARHDRVRASIRALFGDEFDEARLDALSRAKGRKADNVAARAASREVRRLRQSRAVAIVVGPWLGDPLHELLYWIPFVRNQIRKHGLEPSRMVVLSRGGVQAWYRGLGGDHVSVDDHLAGKDLAQLTRRWHDAFAKADRATLPGIERDVLRACGLDSAEFASWPASVLAPALASFRRCEVPLRVAADQFDFTGIKPVGNSQIEQCLPAEFVAAARPNGAGSEILLRAYSAVASRLPVVAADTGADWPTGPEAVDVRFPLGDVYPSRSLAAQSVVVGRAAAYVGPWGHLVVMAVVHGVQTVALVAGDRPPNRADVDLVHRLAWELDVPFHLLDLEQLETAATVADAVATVPVGQSLA